MEWMLQVVDEIDDLISAVRHGSVGLAREIGLALAGLMAIAAIGTAAWMGAESLLVCAAAAMLSVAAALKASGWSVSGAPLHRGG